MDAHAVEAHDDEVANAHVVTVWNLQIGVLVVELVDPPIRVERSAYTVPHARERHRQIDVE